MFTETKRIPRYKEDRRAATACSIATGDELPVGKAKGVSPVYLDKKKAWNSAVPVRRPRLAQHGWAFARARARPKGFANKSCQ